VGVGSRPQIRQSFKIPACAGMTTKADVPTVRASPAASIRLSPMRPFDNCRSSEQLLLSLRSIRQAG